MTAFSTWFKVLWPVLLPAIPPGTEATYLGPEAVPILRGICRDRQRSLGLLMAVFSSLLWLLSCCTLSRVDGWELRLYHALVLASLCVFFVTFGILLTNRMVIIGPGRMIMERWVLGIIRRLLMLPCALFLVGIAFVLDRSTDAIWDEGFMLFLVWAIALQFAVQVLLIGLTRWLGRSVPMLGVALRRDRQVGGRPSLTREVVLGLDGREYLLRDTLLHFDAWA